MAGSLRGGSALHASAQETAARRRPRRALLALLGGGLAGLALPSRLGGAAPAPTRRDFAVYYAGKDDPALAEFGLLVLDADSHPALTPIARRAAQRPVFLGYLSLAEVAPDRRYFDWLRREKLLFGENPDWSHSAYIDLRSRRWQSHVVEVLVPAILAAGFDGVFLDTLDDAAEHEEREPKRFKGMRSAAIDMVRAVRTRFPAIKLMMNRGFALLPALGGTIDMVLGESLLATYDFAAKTHGWAALADYESAVGRLRAEQRRRPALAVYTLDYWDPADAVGIARIYATQRRNGFIPYVATIALDRIVAEPPA
jgi:uncharacterized protein (TIGR01370 family)